MAPSCAVTASDIDIGTIIPGQASSSGTGTMTVKCTKSTAYTYYVGFRQWGTDCGYLEGKNYGDRILYSIKNLQTGNDGVQPNQVNNYSGTGLYNVAGTGMGTQQNLSFRIGLQTAGIDFGICTTPIKSPGVGYNPFVTPDVYSDTLVFGIKY